MTDTTASSAFPEPQEHYPLARSGESQDEIISESRDGWETVAFPGQLSIMDDLNAEAERIAEAEGIVEETTPEPTSESRAENARPTAGDEVTEPASKDLLLLIQDLNQCNDALLLRVTELEEALERSQVALQAEIERHQTVPGGLPVSRPPGPVQQQLAQLLSELDIANDGLRRTTIHNETLQAELDGSQQRVAQLERECTLLQQRFSEKNTALHQAEETCRDLKARLHRQQRYTLQFKAALEKCLTMTPSSSTMGSSTMGLGVVAPVDLGQDQLLIPSPQGEPGKPVSIPRSQQIQPWGAGAAATDQPPNLTQLLRGLRGTSYGSSYQRVEAQPPDPLPSPAGESAEAVIPVAPSPVAKVPEPSISMPQAVADANDPWLEETPDVATSPDVVPVSLFTEPSPWGDPTPSLGRSVAPPEPGSPLGLGPDSPSPAPAMPPDATLAPDGVVNPAEREPVAPPAAPPVVPAYLSTNSQSSPSPLVYPLRSQKKIKSIGAVELPSFGRSVRRR